MNVFHKYSDVHNEKYSESKSFFFLDGVKISRFLTKISFNFHNTSKDDRLRAGMFCIARGFVSNANRNESSR
eukprot:UN04343